MSTIFPPALYLEPTHMKSKQRNKVKWKRAYFVNFSYLSSGLSPNQGSHIKVTLHHSSRHNTVDWTTLTNKIMDLGIELRPTKIVTLVPASGLHTLQSCRRVISRRTSIYSINLDIYILNYLSTLQLFMYTQISEYFTICFRLHRCSHLCIMLALIWFVIAVLTFLPRLIDTGSHVWLVRWAHGGGATSYIREITE